MSESGDYSVDVENTDNECNHEELDGFIYSGYYEGSHYYISNSSLYWDDANEEALFNQGHLVVINSSEEQNYLESILPTTQLIHTGSVYSKIQIILIFLNHLVVGNG